MKHFRVVSASSSYTDLSRPGSMPREEAERTYDRSWEEIEGMLNKAIERRAQWKKWFEQCRDDGDREGMKEAARHHKALDGVVKTLRWTLGEVGVDHPLD